MGMGGNVTSAGWQVTQVTYLLTYLLTGERKSNECAPRRNGNDGMHAKWRYYHHSEVRTQLVGRGTRHTFVTSEAGATEKRLADLRKNLMRRVEFPTHPIYMPRFALALAKTPTSSYRRLVSSVEAD